MIFDARDGRAVWEDGPGPGLGPQESLQETPFSGVNRFFGFNPNGEIYTTTGPAEPKPQSLGSAFFTRAGELASSIFKAAYAPVWGRRRHRPTVRSSEGIERTAHRVLRGTALM